MAGRVAPPPPLWICGPFSSGRRDAPRRYGSTRKRFEKRMGNPNGQGQLVLSRHHLGDDVRRRTLRLQSDSRFDCGRADGCRIRSWHCRAFRNPKKRDKRDSCTSRSRNNLQLASNDDFRDELRGGTSATRTVAFAKRFVARCFPLWGTRARVRADVPGADVTPLCRVVTALLRLSPSRNPYEHCLVTM